MISIDCTVFLRLDSEFTPVVLLSFLVIESDLFFLLDLFPLRLVLGVASDADSDSFVRGFRYKSIT